MTFKQHQRTLLMIAVIGLLTVAFRFDRPMTIGSRVVDLVWLAVVAVNLGTAGILFLVNVFGAKWAIKVQYLVMALLGLSLVSLLGGALVRFDAGLLQQNLGPAYTGGFSFWVPPMTST